MRIPKWFPWAVGVTLPVVYFAVKWSRPWIPEFSAPPVATASVGTEQADPSRDTPDVVKKVFGSAGKDLRTVTYRMSKGGKPRTCDIADESGRRLMKCSFGYNVKPGPSQGELVEVWMFDARGAAMLPGEKEQPLRRIIRVGADGQRPSTQTVDVAPAGVVDSILGTSLVGFNPMTDWTASVPALPR